MAIQLCPVDTANVHPRNILGSSSSFDRERLSPFGSLSSRCWEAPAGGHGDLSPSSVQKQHGEHPARKMWLRRAVLAEVGDGAAYVPYATLTDAQLAGLPVADVLAADALLFCWTTNQRLGPAFRLLEAWGPAYWFTMTWVKNGGIQLPNGPMFNAEWAVVGRKGHPKFTDIKAFRTANAWPRGKHSEKPDGFYDLLRRVTPGPRLDIFGRRRIAGFTSWGNEAPEGPALPDHYQQVLLDG